MTNQLIKLSAVAAAIVAVPALSTAQSVAYSTSPVSVTACSANEAYVPESPYGGLPDRFVTSGIALGYINKSDTPATTVKISVNDGTSTRTFVTSGTFAPGVNIERTFAATSGLDVAQHATCNVAEVDFADGSAWHAAPRDVANR